MDTKRPCGDARLNKSNWVCCSKQPILICKHIEQTRVIMAGNIDCTMEIPRYETQLNCEEKSLIAAGSVDIHFLEYQAHLLLFFFCKSIHDVIAVPICSGFMCFVRVHSGKSGFPRGLSHSHSEASKESRFLVGEHFKAEGRWAKARSWCDENIISKLWYKQKV